MYNSLADLKSVRSVQIGSGEHSIFIPRLTDIAADILQEQEAVELLSDIWNWALLSKNTKDIYSIAHDIINLTIDSSSSYPLLTNDGLIIDNIDDTGRKKLLLESDDLMKRCKPSALREILEFFFAELALRRLR
jgi:hypothetical protein